MSSVVQAVLHWLCFQKLHCQSIRMSDFLGTWTLMTSNSPFVRFTVEVATSTLLGRLSTRFRSVFMGMFFQKPSVTDSGWCGLAISLCFNSSQKCSLEWRSGVCGGQSSSSAPKQGGVIPELLPRIWKHHCFWCFNVRLGCHGNPLPKALHGVVLNKVWRSGLAVDSAKSWWFLRSMCLSISIRWREHNQGKY